MNNNFKIYNGNKFIYKNKNGIVDGISWLTFDTIIT